MKIVPSLLAASRDFATLKKQLAPLVKNKLINAVHVDVMDGEFVENNTLQFMNAVLVKKLKKAFPRLQIQVHLMVQHPEKFIEEFALAGASVIYFHVEAVTNGKKLQKLKKKLKNVEFALAVNPETKVEKISIAKRVLVMTVHPGKGGQKFITASLKKMKKIRAKYPQVTISVDGGVYKHNIGEVAAAGVNEAVCGTSVFKGNAVNNVKKLINVN